MMASRLFVATTFSALTAAAASAANLRIFLSASEPVGNGHPALPSPDGNGAMNVAAASGNPLLSPDELNTQVNPDGGLLGSRMHIWATGDLGDPDPNVWNGIAFQIQINGSAQIVGGGGLNVTSPTIFRRWETGSDLNPLGTPARFNFIAVTRAGLNLPPLGDGWDNGANAVYLGYLDFGPGDGELFLSVDAAGISRQGGGPDTDRVFFGWGDEPLRGDDFGQISRVPDAVFTPEPASAFLLLCGFAVLRRR